MDYGGTSEYAQALRDTVVMIMIEKRSAVEELDEILAVDGIDMIQWGPADYSMNIGKPGELNDFDVTTAEQQVIKAALKAGVAPELRLGFPAKLAITRIWACATLAWVSICLSSMIGGRIMVESYVVWWETVNRIKPQ